MKQSTGLSNEDALREGCDQAHRFAATRPGLNPDLVFAARDNLRGHVLETPCVLSPFVSERVGRRVYLKRDDLQWTGSFKERGACNVLAGLSFSARKAGVIAASAGNHALGLAVHGARMGVPVTIVMPANAPRVKVARCRALGAHVVLHGDGFASAERRARELAASGRFYFVHPFDEYAVMAGQGTMGLEVLEQVPDVDVLVLPVGGGGLLAGVAAAVKTLKPSVRIVAVEPAAARSLTAALLDGNGAPVAVEATLADGLAVARVGGRCLETVRGLVDQVVTVTEHEIAAAMLQLFEADRTIVEGAGAAALAAALAGKVGVPFGATIVLPLTGANVDAQTFARALQMGVSAQARSFQPAIA